MPLYEYQCEACEKVLEVMQKFSDAPLAECPDCHGKVSKLISRTSFALKGNGWYTTDYKKSSAPASAPASGTAPKAASTESTSAPAAGCAKPGCSASH